jgi:transposase-like protein
MKKEKRKFTAEFKVKVIREHLENQVPVAKLCEQYKLLIFFSNKPFFTAI